MPKPEMIGTFPGCPKIFSTRGSMLSYLLIHQNVKVLVCDEIGGNSCFRQKGDLVLHKLSHN